MLDMDLTWDATLDDLSLGAFFLFQSGETFGPDELQGRRAGRALHELPVCLPAHHAHQPVLLRRAEPELPRPAPSRRAE